MTAQGLIRVDVEERLILLLAELDGFTATADDDTLWLVTPPFNGEPTNRRWIVIGSPDGPLSPEASFSGHGPSVDAWKITCGLAYTGEEDPIAAKRACQDALNQISGMLAANHRLILPDAEVPALGCRDVAIEDVEGPKWSWEQGTVPVAWANFDIGAQADITRNLAP